MLLGLDVGTSSTKALLIGRAGEPVAEASAGYAVEHPGPDRAETDPERWWEAVTSAARRLPAEGRAAVKGIGLSGQMHGVVLCRADGAPVRPAIVWLDGRAASLLGRYPPESPRITGNATTTGMTGPTLAWLEEHEPASIRAARWALLAKDFIRLRLTGEAATDPSDASGTLLAGQEGRFDPGLLAAVGIRPDLLPPVLESSAAAGRLTGAAARDLGLEAGIPVAAGAGDTLAAALGSGLWAEESAQLAIGTSAQVVVPRASWPGFSPRLNVYRAASPAGLPRWCLMAAMLNGGLALDWARGTLRLTWDEAFSLAFAEGALRSEAVFLPFLTGERTPWMDPDLRAGWMGVGAADDAGSLMRAALTGVAFSIRSGLEALREHGAAPARLRLAGGGTVHPAFRQLLSDAVGLPLDAVSVPNAAARGAALLGGLAAGVLSRKDLPALAPEVTPVAEPGSAAELAARYARFLDLRARLAGWFRAAGGRSTEDR
ncbi:MAG TPA: FGGY family carbohydrate kinase [Anaeromyxobacter sp.]|nr:FGGY family carbohydrate kinase [Anaeromyxobacter sp.]